MMTEEIFKKIDDISKTLDTFISNEKIIKEDVEKVFPKSIDTIAETQVKMLNDGRIHIGSQRILFGALRNLIIVLESMQLSLCKAPPHENPTTAEKCKEIIPLMINLTNGINKYDKERDEKILDYIFTSSRILRKNSINLGIFKSLDDQFKELSMNPENINEFLNDLNKRIETELEI